ncbi:hypothetical protein PR202_ga22550 [Eleusine coracana subsp. coracana]|uniref:DUF8039 domain-containing protein n=1 Tax=Eleusine coracana subsp. coracana TaxID=191504 RepID=A0AAV5D3Y4_ELECO|nr:hypothetical protein PR202_ga22550 [Eleusine coracana subsp. coracana]
MVAYGFVEPLDEGTLFRDHPIPKGYTMVHLDIVKCDHRKSKLDYPGDEGEFKLEKNIGRYILWRRRDIGFGDSDSECSSKSNSSGTPRAHMHDTSPQQLPQQARVTSPLPDIAESRPRQLPQSRGTMPSMMPPKKSISLEHDASSKRPTSSQQQTPPKNHYSTQLQATLKRKLASSRREVCRHLRVRTFKSDVILAEAITEREFLESTGITKE